jgi:hypothetical protein
MNAPKAGRSMIRSRDQPIAPVRSLSTAELCRGEICPVWGDECRVRLATAWWLVFKGCVYSTAGDLVQGATAGERRLSPLRNDLMKPSNARPNRGRGANDPHS